MDKENSGRLTVPEVLDAFSKLTWYDKANCQKHLYGYQYVHIYTHTHSMDRDAKWLAWFEQQFSTVAGSDRQIDLQEFKHALHLKDVSTTNQDTSPPILDSMSLASHTHCREEGSGHAAADELPPKNAIIKRYEIIRC